RIERGPSPGTLRLTGYGWEAEGVPLSSVRALATRRFVSRDEGEELREFQEARDNPPVGRDLLALLKDGPSTPLRAGGTGRRHVISCAVDSIGRSGPTVVVGQVRKTFPWAEVEWLVLSPGAGPKAAPGSHWLELADGSRVQAHRLEFADGSLSAQNGTARYRVSGGELLRIRIASDAYRYLSDLEPASVDAQPFLDVVWPARFDR
ncbi:unnamed protein product, partial [marine sediment metagenome]